MKLRKCPRCELNYIKEDETYCSVCVRDLKGDQVKDDNELCSVCNEEKPLPGRDVCFLCLKEMTGNTVSTPRDVDDTGEATSLGLNPVSVIDEIIPEIPEELPDREYSDVSCEFSSLESIRESEDNDNDDEGDEI